MSTDKDARPKRAESQLKQALVERGRTVTGDPADAEIGAEEVASNGLTGVQIGPYRVLSLLGRGGMGSVYLAKRADDEFQQQVAIKVLNLSATSDALVERLRQERQILANLSHPNISRLLDGGTTADGLPYLVLEHIEGERIDLYCDKHALTVRERLGLFRQVCAAVASAHQQLIVHRDIKPANILVTTDGFPKLLDFGVAKLLAVDPNQTPSLRTQAGQAMMTPTYASPEQLRGEPVTTATDVYGLGLLLFTLLTGELPYRIRPDDLGELVRAITSGSVPRPSSLFGTQPGAPGAPGADTANDPGAATAACRQASASQLRRTLRGDLDTIALTALQKRPAERYASVEQLSEDVRRYLDGEPISAHPGTLLYRGRKFARRYAGPLAAATALLATSTGFAVVLALQAAALRVERDRALAAQAEVEMALVQAANERDKADQVTTFLVDLFALANPRQGLASGITTESSVVDLLAAGKDQLDAQLADQPARKGLLLDTIGGVYFELGLYEPARDSLTEALTLLEANEADDSTGTGVSRTLYRLGSVARAQGDPDAARAYLTRALARQREATPEASAAHTLALAGTLGQLGVVEFLARDLTQADAHLSEAHALVQSLGDGTHATDDTTVRTFGMILRHLAIVRFVSGQVDEAEALFRDAIDLAERRFGVAHPETADSYVNAATFFNNLDDAEQAKPLFEKALAIYRAAFPDGIHPNIATTLDNLGVLHAKRGERARALELFEQARDIRVQRLGPDHIPSVLNSHFNIAYLHYSNLDFAAALPALHEVLRIYGAAGDPVNPRRATTLLMTAHASLALGLREEASEWLTALEPVTGELSPTSDRHHAHALLALQKLDQDTSPATHAAAAAALAQWPDDDAETAPLRAQVMQWVEARASAGAN